MNRSTRSEHFLKDSFHPSFNKISFPTRSIPASDTLILSSSLDRIGADRNDRRVNKMNKHRRDSLAQLEFRLYKLVEVKLSSLVSL